MSPALACPCSESHLLTGPRLRSSPLESILFGKFHKAHPCNLRDFKVYGGPSADPNSGLWMRLLRAGLRNDAQPEEFALKWCDADGLVSILDASS